MPGLLSFELEPERIHDVRALQGTLDVRDDPDVRKRVTLDIGSPVQ